MKKDWQQRKEVSTVELNRQSIRTLLRFQETSQKVQGHIQSQWNLCARIAIPSKVRNRCVITFRNRSVNSRYRLSRFFLKYYGERQLFPGFHKSSW